MQQPRRNKVLDSEKLVGGEWGEKGYIRMQRDIDAEEDLCGLTLEAYTMCFYSEMLWNDNKTC